MLGRTGFIIFILTVFLSGCGTLMPYNTEFQCSSPDKGKCATVKAAYDESKKNSVSVAVGKSSAEDKDPKKDIGSEKPMEKPVDFSFLPSTRTASGAPINLSAKVCLFAVPILLSCSARRFFSVSGTWSGIAAAGVPGRRE